MNFYFENGQANLEQRNSSEQAVFLPPAQPAQQPQISSQSSKKVTQKRKSTKFQFHWNNIEERRYIRFLIQRRELFDLSNYDKKCIKINRKIEEFVKTRSAAQIHSHHQKMLIKHGSVDGIIWANFSLINIKHVPMRFRALRRELEEYRRTKRGERAEAVGLELQSGRESSSIVWPNLYLCSDHFLSCQPFGEDASSLI